MIDDLRIFIDEVDENISRGTVRVTRTLSDYDVAVMYAVDKLYKMGLKTVSPEQIWHMLAIIAPELAEQAEEVR